MMKTFGFALAIALLAAAVPARAARVDCEPARCAVQATLATECPCETAGNHGLYVSCVVHVVRRLVADGTVPVTCKGKVTRCAAKSTCGKDGFVTCQIPTDTCVVDPATGLGTCADDPTLACVTDLDCGAKCKIKSSADRCTTRGGFVGTASSCCPGCGG